MAAGSAGDGAAWKHHGAPLDVFKISVSEELL